MTSRVLWSYRWPSIISITTSTNSSTRCSWRKRLTRLAQQMIYLLNHEQNGCCLAHDIFKCIFLNNRLILCFSFNWSLFMRVLLTTCHGYCQTSNISCTLISNKIVAHSEVVGAAPTTSSFSTKYLVSLDWAKTNARRDKNHLSFGIWCDLY